MKDFRPIACCNTIYKIISRILAARLKTLMPIAIEPNQSAFIKGRLLLENVLLATELTKDYHRSGIAPRAALKIDISKAFDSVNWDFILQTLMTMSFPMQYVHWIRACISSASFTISINGNLEGYFTSCRGLRQGCSLSPSLFNLAMNVLSLLLNKAAATGHIGYHPNCAKLSLTHLSFADDLMIFFDGTSRSLQAIMDTLLIFSSMSGLSINASKSSLFYGGSVQPSLMETATQLGIPIGQLPIRYLGLPLTTKRMRKIDYEPLVDKIRNKLQSWTHRFLSYGGRLQLIKAVIISITNFWQSVFRLPQGCLTTIERLCSSFLWTGSTLKTSGIKVSWQKLCVPYSEGGLGIRSFRDTNIVFSLHLIWRLFANKNSFWVSWVQQYLFRQSSFWDISITSTKGSWIWRKLLKLRPLASTLIKVQIKSGLNTYFWHDTWLGDQKLWDINLPFLPVELGIARNALVADAYSDQGWLLRRSRSHFLGHIYDKLNDMDLPNVEAGRDIFLWKAKDGSFKRKFNSSSTWNLVRSPQQKVEWWKVVWFPLALPRQSFILWMTIRDCLATGDKMRNWGIVQSCVFCGEFNESRDHLFFACPYTFQAWLLIARNLIKRAITPDWSSTLSSIIRGRYSAIDHLLLKLALQTLVYAIWKERNSRTHGSHPQAFHILAKNVAQVISTKISTRRGNLVQSNKLVQRWQNSWNNGQTSLVI